MLTIVNKYAVCKFLKKIHKIYSLLKEAEFFEKLHIIYKFGDI